MMFYLGFFVGWVIGILSVLLFIYLIRSETESVADGERVCGKVNPMAKKYTRTEKKILQQKNGKKTVRLQGD